MTEQERNRAVGALKSMRKWAKEMKFCLENPVWQPNQEAQTELNDAIFRYFEACGWPRWAGTNYDDIP